MKYDFDIEIDRRNTNSLKYDFAVERGHLPDVLPLWVADMDFPAPPCVLDALQKAVSHGIFGYSQVKEDYHQLICDWFSKHYDWHPKPRWIVKTPGVVFAISAAIRGLTEEGDSVLIQTPVYYPFYNVIKNNHRKLVTSEVKNVNGHYEIDFQDLEEKIRDHRVKLLILCSPHNPIGRVWTQAELQKIGALSKAYDFYVVSDEIHCDFAFDEYPHTPYLKANPDLQDKSVVCTSPSKSFNIAGLQISHIFIPDETLRQKIQAAITVTGYDESNALGLVAARAAYTDGEEWLSQVKQYMRENLDFLRDYLAQKLPQLTLVEPEGMYFAWIDFSNLGLTPSQLDKLIGEDAGLWLDSGRIFGDEASQYQRIVLACTRKTLTRALDQLYAAITQSNILS